MLAEKEFEADQRLAIKKKKKMGRPSFARSKGKPWVMHEAFQIVIKAQVEFLIKLGVNQQLKDIVRQIWFGYLHKAGIAFCANPTHLLSSKKGMTVRRKIKLSKNKKVKGIKMEISDDELFELSSQLGEETYYSGDDPTRAQAANEPLLAEDEDKTEGSGDESDDSGEESIGSFVTGSRSRPRPLHLRDTIAFCYLGLLWMDEPVFLSDLIRWAKEGHFPYFQAARLLPDYMRLAEQDSKALTVQTVPERKDVLADAFYINNRLLRLPIPERDVTMYTARYILDLDLPGIVHGFVQKLLGIFKPNKSCRLMSTPHYEETAMAYIMLALKLCYGLDDTEHEKQASLVTPCDASDSRHDALPVWTDWASCARECQARRQACGVPWTEEQLRHTRDPRAYGTFCKTAVFGSWAFRDLEMVEGRASIGPKKKCVRQEYRENCAEIFSSLAEDSNRSDPQTCAQTSFPFSCRHNSNGDDNNCFQATRARRIPLDSVKLLCHTSSSTEQNNEQCREREETVGTRKYVRYLRLDSYGDTRHPSYQFLLRLLSSRIESTPDELEELVAKLEAVVVSDPSGEPYYRTHLKTFKVF